MAEPVADPRYDRNERFWPGARNRVLQTVAMSALCASAMRVSLHRLRGVRIGNDVWIGQDALIETACPEMVSIGDRVTIGIRATILAHFQELTGVQISDDVYVGACAVILPGVTIGNGAVITAGSVVTASVPPMTVVQGNPARRVARCGIPLGLKTSRVDFMTQLTKLDNG
jgi:acetyltransferase-like isoleucine patch superfamily enzyme